MILFAIPNLQLLDPPRNSCYSLLRQCDFVLVIVFFEKNNFLYICSSLTQSKAGTSVSIVAFNDPTKLANSWIVIRSDLIVFDFSFLCPGFCPEVDKNTHCY